MKIAIYGGSFNPMHIGHEKIVDYVLKNLDMDKIIIIPVGIPSHRENNLEESDTRLKICREIFKSNEKVEVSDIEIKSERKSYTYDTLLKLIEIYGKDNKFFEIIGEDSLKNLKTWKNYKELLNLCKFIVFRRKDDKNTKIDSEFLNNKNIIILENEYYNISSTEIRNKVKNGEDITGLVNEKVKNLIKKEYKED
ncbi:nicotinate (nicotinamide) nucleotide adenylyltransferase [Fusobacterium nucleatum]|nr:nicotinate (nicotinamide) nucleotide adenylyltransferase [Fusobacterium nucleatum]BEP05666.1 nicotinate (nicotinamide) nucleotide adenylyltransferase [Fusobacterium nucleatum]